MFLFLLVYFCLMVAKSSYHQNKVSNMVYTQDSSYYEELGPHFEWELWTRQKWLDPMLPFDWKMNFLTGTSILCTLTPSTVLGIWNKIQDLDFVCCLLSNWSHKIIHKYYIHDFLLFVFATYKYSHLNSNQTKLSRLVRRIIGELRLYYFNACSLLFGFVM